MIDINDYCWKCKRGIVRPYHKECYKRCKYSEPNKEYEGGCRIVRLDYNGQWDVYLIRCENFIKIGQTLDIDKRVESFYRDNPFDIDILILIKGGPNKLERALHKHFEQYRYRREWFFYSSGIKNFIELPKRLLKRDLNKIIYNVDYLDEELIKDIEG